MRCHPTHLLLFASIFLLLHDSHEDGELYENGIQDMSNSGSRHIVMSGKLCVCVFGILFPQKKPNTKEDLEIPEKEFILSVKLVGPNSETGIEEESHNSGLRVAIISIPIHPTL